MEKCPTLFLACMDRGVQARVVERTTRVPRKCASLWAEWFRWTHPVSLKCTHLMVEQALLRGGNTDMHTHTLYIYIENERILMSAKDAASITCRGFSGETPTDRAVALRYRWRRPESQLMRGETVRRPR